MSQFNISWFQSNFQSYQSCYIHKLFKRKKIVFYRQIMVLSFTRYLNGLIFMFHYIAEEQTLPANLQDNNIEKLRGDISMGSADELSI